MKLSIKYVKDPGNLSKERLIIKVLGNVNVGSYLIADTTYISVSEVSDKLRHIFWIPDKQVSENDLVVIYTKQGNDKTNSNKNGSKTHFFTGG